MAHIFEDDPDDECCLLCGTLLESRTHVSVTRPLPESAPLFIRRSELLGEVSAVLRTHGYERMAMLVDVLRDPAR